MFCFSFGFFLKIFYLLFLFERFAQVLFSMDRSDVLQSASGPTINLYPLENYTFGIKEAQLEKDTSVASRYFDNLICISDGIQDYLA
jgi:hypothetical protein